MQRSLKTTAAIVIGLTLGVLPVAAKKAKKQAEPDRVTVQHILISFKGKLGGDRYLDRSKKEAEALARDLLERAEAGEDFDALVQQYSDDGPPGIFRLCNQKVEPAAGEKRRYDMVTAFGDVAFELEVDEIGIAAFHATRSPFGWHIIKRLK